MRKTRAAWLILWGMSMLVRSVSGAVPVLDFAHATARVEMGTGLYSGLTNLTLSVWIRSDTVPASGSYGAIAGRGYLTSGVGGFGIYLSNSGNIIFQTRDSATAINASKLYPFDGQWHHVAGVREGNTTRLYFDGELASETNGALSSLYTSTISFGLGMRHRASDDTWAYPFAGRMADVQLWNHARTGAQIQQDMFRRLAGTEGGLVGYWELDEGTGATATDLVAGKNGTCNNAFWTTDAVLPAMLPAADAAHFGFWPFTVEDPRTGSTRVTDTNTVEVAAFPIPEGCNAYQLSASAEPSEVDPSGWISTNTPPDTSTLDASAGRAVVYAWFTNTASAVALRGSAASIVHYPTETALDFNVLSEQRVEMPQNLFPWLQNLTLSAWIKTTVKPASGSYGTIAGRGLLSSSNSGFGLFLNGNGEIVFQARYLTTAVQAATPYPFDGAWHHVAGVRSGNTTRLYLDGQLAAEATASLTSLYKAGLAFGLGARHNGSFWEHFYVGEMAEVRLWDGARTAGQIQADMFTCLTGSEKGLLGYWPLSEGEGSAVVDRTDIGNDGTTVNAPVWVTDEAVSATLPASRNPARQGFWPMTLADLDTGDARLSDSNKVQVSEFPVPDGYSSYQITLTGDTSTINPAGWISSLTAPETQELVVPPLGGLTTCYAWFTNTTATVPLSRSGGAILYAPHVPALSFAATSARVEMARNLYSGLTNLTLSVWLKPAGVPQSGGFYAIAGRGYLALDVSGFGLYLKDDGTVSFQTRDSGGAIVFANAAYPQDGAWHHVAGVRDGDVTRLYIDGQMVSEASGALPSLYTAGIPFGLGARFASTSWGHFYKGAMAEVQMWSVARTEAAIKKDRFYRLTGTEEGLLGYWPLDEGLGQRVYDRAVAANHGMLSVSAWEYTNDFLRDRPPPGMMILLR